MPTPNAIVEYSIICLKYSSIDVSVTVIKSIEMPMRKKHTTIAKIFSRNRRDICNSVTLYFFNACSLYTSIPIPPGKKYPTKIPRYMMPNNSKKGMRTPANFCKINFHRRVNKILSKIHTCSGSSIRISCSENLKKLFEIYFRKNKKE